MIVLPIHISHPNALPPSPRRHWGPLELNRPCKSSAPSTWPLAVRLLVITSSTAQNFEITASYGPMRRVTMTTFLFAAGSSKDDQWDLLSSILNRAWLQSRWREAGFPAWLSRASRPPGCRWHLFLN